MAESLYIKNLGPIKEVDLANIPAFTVLVGESGSGKSTAMKVLSMFRWIYKRVVLRSYVRQANIKKTGIGIQMKTLMKSSGIFEFVKPSTEIIYKREGYEISYKNKKLNAQADVSSENLSLEKICFISDKRAIISDFQEDKIERRLSNYYLQDTMNNFLAAAKEVKSLPIDFLNVSFNVTKSANGTKYEIKGEGEDNYTIKLRNASSGTQTVVPLCMIVEYYAKHFDPKKSMDSSLFQYLSDNDKLTDFNTAKNIGDIHSKNVHILIEEPELSLNPISQNALLDYLITNCFRQEKSYNMSLMLATHSPYIVNYINLLMQRCHLADREGVVYLNPSMVEVYHIEDGYAYPLKSDSDNPVIDSRLMSDPISDIYTEYNDIRI